MDASEKLNRRDEAFLRKMYAEFTTNAKPFLDILLRCEQYRGCYILTVDDNGKQTITPGPLSPEVQSLYDRATEGLRYLREDFERRVKPDRSPDGKTLLQSEMGCPYTQESIDQMGDPRETITTDREPASGEVSPSFWAWPFSPDELRQATEGPHKQPEDFS